jgi:hypothetical protein
MTNGAKIGIDDGTRATAQLVHEDLMQAALRQAGYDTNMPIDAIRVADAPNERNLAGFISARMNYVLKTIRDQDGGIFSDNTRSRISRTLGGAGLNIGFSDDNKSLSVEDPLEKWRDLSDRDRQSMLRQLLLRTEDLADVFFKGRAY